MNQWSDIAVHDGTRVVAAQHPPFRALQKEPPGGPGHPEPADHGLGRSRGGWTTKLHLGCEQARKPLGIVITAGQRGDSPQFTTVLEQIRVPRQGPGRPRTRPDRVLADKAYSSRATRFDKLAVRYEATVHVASINIWLRDLERHL